MTIEREPAVDPLSLPKSSDVLFFGIDVQNKPIVDGDDPGACLFVLAHTKPILASVLMSVYDELPAKAVRTTLKDVEDAVADESRGMHGYVIWDQDGEVCRRRLR